MDSGFSAYWRLLRDNANFRRLWGAQVVSEIGDWFYAVAIYNLLLELTGTATSVGAAVVVQVLPQTFMGPTAGVVNDRVRRKHVMIAADLARIFVVLGMLLVRTRSMVWMVYPLLFLETMMTSFFEPARSAVVPNITSERELLAANTLSSITWSFNLAIGAMLGGVVAVLLGRDAVFALNSVSFLVSAWLIARMRFAEPHVAGSPPFRARELVDFSPILEGLRYIRSDARLLSTVFVKFGIGFIGANNVLLPLFGERVFPVPVAGLSQQRAAMLGMSLLMGARGVGALLGPIVSGIWAGERHDRLRTGILIGFMAAALGYIAIGFAPNLGIALCAVILAHAGGSTNWVFSSTLLQIYTEDRYRGRVFSAELGLLTLTIAVSSFLASQFVDRGVPLRAVAIGTGVAALVPAVGWALTLRGGSR